MKTPGEHVLLLTRMKCPCLPRPGFAGPLQSVAVLKIIIACAGFGKIAFPRCKLCMCLSVTTRLWRHLLRLVSVRFGRLGVSLFLLFVLFGFCFVLFVFWLFVFF